MHSVGIAGKGCCVGVPGSVKQLRYRSQRARRAVANSGAHPNGVTPKDDRHTVRSSACSKHPRAMDMPIQTRYAGTAG